MLAVMALFAATGGDFRHQPPLRDQGDVAVSVAWTDPDKIPALCAELGAEHPSASECVVRIAGMVFMILPNPCKWPDASDMKDLECHAVGHVNGWPANHPDDPVK